MPTIQPQSPQMQRAMLKQGSRGMVYQGGSISKASPEIQAAMRQERDNARKRLIMQAFCLLGAGAIVFATVIYFFDHTAHASKQALTGAEKPVSSEAPALVYVETPETAVDPRHSANFASTPQEFVDRAKVNGVRLDGRKTKAIINGDMYRVGDVVAPEIGLVFVGHDPDGEYLLFRDAKKRTVFLRVHSPLEAS